MICLGAYMLSVVAPAGWMVWCIGSDGHRAIELPHQAVSIARVFDGNGSSDLSKPPNRLISPRAELSYSSIAASSADCVDTPIVSEFPTRDSGLLRVDLDLFRPIPAVAFYMPAPGLSRSAKWFYLADASGDFAPQNMLGVVILQI